MNAQQAMGYNKKSTVFTLAGAAKKNGEMELPYNDKLIL